MFFKSLIAALVVMVLTGILIYWGTAPEGGQDVPASLKLEASQPLSKPNVKEGKPPTAKTGWVDLTQQKLPAKAIKS